jgi:hypothetical protein
MTRPGPDELERLRRAFATVDVTETKDDPPIDSDRIWQAVRGELPPAEVEEMADLANRSPETAAAWRLAVELSHELDGVRSGNVIPIHRRRPLRWTLGLAAAAVVVVGLALPLFRSFSPDPTPTYRAVDGLEIVSELDPDRALPRKAFELRWTPTGEGSLYEILVTDSDLRVLDRASFLEEASYLVSVEALSDLAEGDEVWWKVDATRADGARASSPTFVTLVK